MLRDKLRQNVARITVPLPAIAAQLQTTITMKQPNKLSQLQNNQLNLLTATFLAILKSTEINLRSLIVDASVKRHTIDDYR